MTKTRIRSVSALAAFVGAASVGWAQVDTEPLNNTLPGDAIGLLPMQAGVNIAGLGGGGGDIDYFSQMLLTGEYIVAMTTPLANLATNFNSPDTILGGFSPGGVLQPSNDDGGSDGIGLGPVAPTRGSVIRYQAVGSGSYGVGVTGFNDFGFAGTHTQSGAYAITAARFPFQPAIGGSFADTPPNQVFGGADPLGVVAPGAVNAVCDLTGIPGGPGGDVDFFSVFLNAGDILSAMTTPFATFPNSPDTLLGVFDPAGSLLYYNDDAGTDWDLAGPAGPTRGSAVRYMATAPGVYYIGVTGFNDSDFDGLYNGVPHPEIGLYGLTVSVIPTPASGALLGLATLLVARRRRNA